MALMQQLASQRRFTIRNMIGGGHCGFAAVQVGLAKLGIVTTHQELRQNVCAFLRHNPLNTDGVHYKYFLGAAHHYTLIKMLSGRHTYSDCLKMSGLIRWSSRP